jgi:hypothetical protein
MDEEKIKIDVVKLREKIGHLELDVKLEGRDDYIAAEILIRLLENRQVSPEQLNFLKGQSIDFTKVLALIGLQAIPGSSLAIIVIEKLAEKHGFSLFPNPNRETPDMS